MGAYNKQSLPCKNIRVQNISSLDKKPSIELYSSYLNLWGISVTEMLDTNSKLKKKLDIVQNTCERQYP